MKNIECGGIICSECPLETPLEENCLGAKFDELVGKKNLKKCGKCGQEIK